MPSVPRSVLYVGVLSLIGMSPLAFSYPLTLQEAQSLAVQHDPLLKGSEWREKALSAEKVAADTWENPIMSTSLMNLPVNGFSLSQEPMTQFKVGIKQRLPRGETNAIKSTVFDLKARQEMLIREGRRWQLIHDVSQLWLNWYHSEQKKRVYNAQIQLLKPLLEVTESRYRQGVNQSQQQDVLNVRMAMLRLQDDLTQADLDSRTAIADMSFYWDAPAQGAPTLPDTFSFPQTPTLLDTVKRAEPVALMTYHPSAHQLALNEKIARQNLALANETGKPQWAIEASYGHRQEAQNGASRADFFSIGVQVDLPYFTTSKRNAETDAASARMHAAATDFRLRVRELAARALSLQEKLSVLQQRKALYESGLLQQSKDLIEVSLASYTSDAGSFNDVIDASINRMNVELESLSIETQIMRVISELTSLYIPAVTVAEKLNVEIVNTRGGIEGQDVGVVTHEG